MARPTPAPRSDVPPPLPPRTPDMIQFQNPPATLGGDQSMNPPPLPPKPGSFSRMSTGKIKINEWAPPLPPKPSKTLPRSISFPDAQNLPSKAISQHPGIETYDTVSLPLFELTNNLTTNIPSSVAVREFSKVHNAPCSLAEGDILDLHFSKSTRIAHVLSISNMSLMVPVNSPMLCSVLYDPVDDIDRALKGYIFGSGSQLLCACPHPQFIAVEKGSIRTKVSSAFTVGEILVVKGLNKKNASFLECQTIPDCELKYVHSSTIAVFTTNPDKIKMHLSEVVKHLEYQIKVKFYPQDQELQQHMRKPYTLLNVGSQKSVIATYGSFKGSLPVSTNQYVLEIFADAPLKCDLLQLTKPEKRDVIRKSKKLFESFSPSCVNEIIVDVPLAVHACQTHLFSTVEQVHGTLSRTRPLIHNASITGVRTGHVPIPVPTTTAQQGSLYTPAAAHSLPTSAHPRQHSLPLGTDFPAIEVAEDPYSLSPGNLFHPGSSADIDDIYDDFVSQKLVIDLSVNEVLLILENLGLTQYKGIFAQERITGARLVRLDENMLERDFGMQSRLHRMKIMEVISGQDPIDSLLR